jgi:hypothetical protein
MSHQLIKAAASGRVVVENKTSSEVMVILVPTAGAQKSIIIPPYTQVELAPKHIDANLVGRSPNLNQLVGRYLRVIQTWR